MNPFEQIETERLILRKWTPEIAQKVFYMDLEKQMEFLGVFSEEQLHVHRERFEKGLSTFNRDQLYFWIFPKNGRESIGWCGYHTWYTWHDRAEIGYELFEEGERKKGYMKEALAAILKYGLTAMKLHRIEAFVAPTNEASLRLVRHFGFREEGHLIEHYQRDGVWEDSLAFGLLKHEESAQKICQ
ncbi:MAG: N-acetyltransferase [Bacteroidetes bacterium]|nr:MAG: N-acetyltransferase [Bacteroidota bacterium]